LLQPIATVKLFFFTYEYHEYTNYRGESWHWAGDGAYSGEVEHLFRLNVNT